MAATLAEYISSQDDLIQEAAEALPHQFSQCSYPLGPIRQAVYLCLTCPEPRGLCSACSVACHTDHEQIELFPKRNFRCDCPTSAVAHSCTLHQKLEAENDSNHYGQNFKAQFCRCGRPYDAKTERETMIQCLACEDWFHESCCNLRERPTSREASPEQPEPEAQNTGNVDAGDEAASEASSSGLPPALITADDYDSFVCGSCVSSIPTLKRWAGTPGTMMVVRDDASQGWRILNEGEKKREDIAGDVDVGDVEVTIGSKRSRSPSAAAELEPESKRPRAESDSITAPAPLTSASSSTSGPCLAPPVNDLAQSVISDRATKDLSSSLGTGDLFLAEGFRDRWCRCASCLPSLQARQYLLEEEETYEPPEDPDSGLSLEELGMRALQRLPRERAIEGVHAFNAMRDDLVKYLRPFASEGKTVSESDINSFFEALKEGRRSQGSSA